MQSEGSESFTASRAAAVWLLLTATISSLALLTLSATSSGVLGVRREEGETMGGLLAGERGGKLPGSTKVLCFCADGFSSLSEAKKTPFIDGFSMFIPIRNHGDLTCHRKNEGSSKEADNDQTFYYLREGALVYNEGLATVGVERFWPIPGVTGKDVRLPWSPLLHHLSFRKPFHLT